MNCPRCRDDLRQTERTGVVIDYCPRCRGVWLDGGELEKIIDRSYSWESGGYPPTQGQAGGHHQDHQQPHYQQSHHHDQHHHQQHHYQQSHHQDHHRHDHRHDHRYDDHHYGHRGHHKHKKKSLLGEIFDIFD